MVDVSIKLQIPLQYLEEYSEEEYATVLDILENQAIQENLAMKGYQGG